MRESTVLSEKYYKTIVCIKIHKYTKLPDSQNDN